MAVTVADKIEFGIQVMRYAEQSAPVVAKLCAELIYLARQHEIVCTMLCNDGDQPKLVHQKDRIEGKINALCVEKGMVATFHDDPRGNTVIIGFCSGHRLAVPQ